MMPEVRTVRWGRGVALVAVLASTGCATAPIGSPRDASAIDGGPSVSDDGGVRDGGATPDGAPAPDATAGDAGPSCADPPGSACNPIVIDRFPFRHEGDTSSSSADAIDAYACAPDADEGGPEIHYEIRLTDARRLHFAVEEASGVDVDLNVLAAPDPAACVARANTTLDQPLAAGTFRLVVDTFRSGADRAGAYVLTVDAAAPVPRSLGTMWNTFYFLASEDDHSGPQDTPIYDASCREIARVREAFHDSVCIEGSGLLADGRVINYASTCTTSCPSAHTCGSQSYRICYSTPDPAVYPWGIGSGSRALEPDRSMAVDPDFVAIGTWVYFEELDGLVPPGSTTPHDGCLRADDVGGAIDGEHFDFFAGTRSRWLAWEGLLPTRSTLHAYVDDPRCYPRPR